MSDWEFIFDGVFGFLSSPMWLAPIMHFIENQSVVFKESEENYHEWTQIHKQYGELVESLLSSYLQDVGITEEQFVQACKTPGVEERADMQQIFEQLWASDDFEIFKRMMIQKNVELELQALELVRKRQGKKAKQQKKKTKSKVAMTEDEILAQVMKQSELEYQEHQKRLEDDETETKSESKFDDAMEKVLSESTNHFEKLEKEVELKEQETKQYVEENISQELTTKEEEVPEPKPSETKKSEPAKPKSPVKTSTASSEPVKSKSPEIPPLKTKAPLSPIKRSAGSEAASEWMKNAREENQPTASASASSSKGSDMTEDDMAKRIEYLKQQRDRLLAMKKNEREKQLDQYSKTESKKRPTSARVARQAVSGGGAEAAKPAVSAEDAKKIAMRKALAEKLRKEVINK